MNLVIGEILFDIFPDYQRLGGAPFNVAFHLKHFGLPVRFISRVGADRKGEAIREFLTASGFRLQDLQIDRGHPTGTVRVELDSRGVPQFDIIADVAYDYLEVDSSLISSLADGVDLIYYGTLIQRSDNGYRMLQHLLKGKDLASQCFYDVNLRPNCFSPRTVRDSLEQADHVKVSRQELGAIREMFAWTGRAAEIGHWLMETFGLQTLSLTKGEAGSELFTTTGHYSAPAIHTAEVVDTVGAGDAYTAVVIAGLRRNWQPERILSAAAEFAARICQVEGALPQDASIYEGVLEIGEGR